MALTITVIVCAYNEAGYLPACLYPFALRRGPPTRSSWSTTRAATTLAPSRRAVPGVRVVDEPSKGLVVARETAQRLANSDILAYVDADCRVPIYWRERLEQRFLRLRGLVGMTGPYRFYDWDWSGRTLIRLYDMLVAPATHGLVHHVLGIGAVFYGGNFAVRGEALARIGGFDRSIEFHGEDTNLGRRLTALGPIAMCPECWIWTSARRYRAMGKSRVLGLYVRNFWSEILRGTSSAEHQGIHRRGPDSRGDPRGNPPAGRVEHRLPSSPPDDAARRDRDVLSLGSPQASGAPG